MVNERIRILHLGDDPDDGALVAHTLGDEGLACEIVAVDSRDAFTAALSKGDIDIILADDRLPSFDGRTAQKIAAELAPSTPFIVVSGSLGEEIAIRRMKDGAAVGALDYLTKPLDLERLGALLTTVRKGIERREALLKIDADIARQFEFEGMIGRSAVMQDLFDSVRRLAPHAVRCSLPAKQGRGRSSSRAPCTAWARVARAAS